MIPQLPRLLQGNVVLLDGQRLNDFDKPQKALGSLHMVPALHVDCEEDIDIDDLDTMMHRAEVFSPSFKVHILAEKCLMI